jgi:hypothetical protein
MGQRISRNSEAAIRIMVDSLPIPLQRAAMFINLVVQPSPAKSQHSNFD